jgi:folate-binding protein YgfZ
MARRLFGGQTVQRNHRRETNPLTRNLNVGRLYTNRRSALACCVLQIPRIHGAGRFDIITSIGVRSVKSGEENVESKVDIADQEKVRKWLQSYEADALIVHHRQPGLIFASGQTALDLLDRMSTNDLSQVQIESIHSTVLTDVHARIIDRIKVLSTGDGLLVLTSPGRESSVREWLTRHIFFQDDVTLTGWDEGWSHWGIYGPKAAEKIREIAPGSRRLEAGEVQALEGLFIWGTDELGPAYRMLFNEATSKLAEQSWTSDEAAQLAFEILRIQSGIPLSPSEISDEFIPLEVGLWDAVSFSKGCYIGQEIIARLESRGRLAKQLYFVQMDQSVPTGSEIRQGSTKIGKLTSLVYAPDSGWIGLTVAKPGASQRNNGRVLIGDEGIRGQLKVFTSARHGPPTEKV